jgi:hypothetical protein
MAFSYGWRGPNIVKDGLTLYLDAGSPNSYYAPTAGTTWKDISGTNNSNCILTNGPTYSVSGSGTFILDGSDDYIVSANQITPTSANGSATIEAYFNLSSTTGTIFNIGQSGVAFNFGMKLQGGVLQTRNTNSDASLGGGATIFANNWYQAVITYDSSGAIGYVNGVSIGTNAQKVTSISNNIFYVIGARAYNSATELITGRVALIRVYQNKALTATEVLQNYNATKTRFGL